MRVAFSHKSIAVTMSPIDRDKLELLWPMSRWSAGYDPNSRELLLMPCAKRGSLIRKSGGHKAETWTMSWERSRVAHGGRLFPFFAILNAEKTIVTKTGVIIIVPDEKKRQPPIIVKQYQRKHNRLKPLGILPVTMPNVEPNVEPKKLDLLDALRHYRDALNGLRRRHPEIGFRVKKDGLVSIELLLAE